MSYCWKACKRQNRFPSSNLGHSAGKTVIIILMVTAFCCNDRCFFEKQWNNRQLKNGEYCFIE